MPSDDPAESKAFDTFTSFPKLSIELRHLIWTFCAPEPAVIMQRKSRSAESRTEYLENGEEGFSPERRQRQLDHPVYKLYFRNGRRINAGTYLCPKIDSILGIKHIYGRSGNISSYSFLASILSASGLAQHFRHLVLRGWLWWWSYPPRPLGENERELSYLMKMFPLLESLTILIGVEWLFDREQDHNLVQYLPEINGELDSTSFNTSHVNNQYIASDLPALCADFARFQKENPEKKYPVIKFRFEEQMKQLEGLEE